MFKRAAVPQSVQAVINAAKAPKMVIPVIPVISVQAPEAAATALAATMGAESTIEAYNAAKASFRTTCPMPSFRTWTDEGRIEGKHLVAALMGR